MTVIVVPAPSPSYNDRTAFKRVSISNLGRVYFWVTEPTREQSYGVSALHLRSSFLNAFLRVT